MAHFRGTICGHRGVASRLGTKGSGLETKAASWQGAVGVQLYAQNGVDMARVSLTTHHGAGTNRLLYDGPVDSPDAPLGEAPPLATLRWSAFGSTDISIATFTSDDYERLAEIVGSLVIAQFDDQEAYRSTINELFGLYVDNAAPPH